MSSHRVSRGKELGSPPDDFNQCSSSAILATHYPEHPTLQAASSLGCCQLGSGRSPAPRCSWEVLEPRVTAPAATTVSHLQARWSSSVTVTFLKTGFFFTISILLTCRTDGGQGCPTATTGGRGRGNPLLAFPPSPPQPQKLFPRKLRSVRRRGANKARPRPCPALLGAFPSKQALLTWPLTWPRPPLWAPPPLRGRKAFPGGACVLIP